MTKVTDNSTVQINTALNSLANELSKKISNISLPSSTTTEEVTNNIYYTSDYKAESPIILTDNTFSLDTTGTWEGKAVSADITLTTDVANGDKIQIGDGESVNIQNAVSATKISDGTSSYTYANLKSYLTGGSSSSAYVGKAYNSYHLTTNYNTKTLTIPTGTSYLQLNASSLTNSSYGHFYFMFSLGNYYYQIDFNLLRNLNFYGCVTVPTSNLLGAFVMDSSKNIYLQINNVTGSSISTTFYSWTVFNSNITSSFSLVTSITASSIIPIGKSGGCFSSANHTVLWSGNSNASSSITISDSFLNYKELMFVTRTGSSGTTSGCWNTSVIPTTLITSLGSSVSHTLQGTGGYYTQYLKFTTSSSTPTILTFSKSGTNIFLMRVYGCI